MPSSSGKSSSAAAISDPASPEIVTYDGVLQSFVDDLQHHRLHWIKQIHADRDTRCALRDLVARVRIDHSTNGPLWLARVKPDLQNVMIDAIVGHHVVWEQLAADASATAQNAARAAAALHLCLRGGLAESGNQDSLDNAGAMLDFLGGSECPDAALKESLQRQALELYHRHNQDLRQLQQSFLQKCGVQDASVALSKTGGWPATDHDHFMKVFKDCEPKGIRNDQFVTRVAAEVTMQPLNAIRAHDTWYRSVRRLAQQRDDSMAEHTRRVQAFKDDARAAIAAATAAAVLTKAKEEELAQRLADQALMHAKVERFKGKRNAKADLAAHQAEIARLEAAAMQQAADRKRQKDHELKKKLLQDHKGWQHVNEMAQEEAKALLRAMEAEERKERDAFNADRVAFRIEEYEQKRDDLKRKALQKAEDDELRQRALDAIKLETPYAEKLNHIAVDPERTRKPTEAFTANVEAIQDGLGIHETGLFPSHGYDTDKLFKDARFKLGIALREAGLGSTDYARKAMSAIAVRNMGAYRHTPQAPSQLW
ncbi:hypothetical protein H310_12993 [Aphanomyces invadans]|uniref:Uncharacterized protein n=1 Tax=Aphanomyces invadans TaxID=157072 RepID=A0A024TFE5_9STRA|nr:hypothetical protein H310_12993 [Aphanomyces invadans]ETV92763.1 hypothetical protein H310_12993 [Aphanomyces invadans]|eukprot:XP_008878533.1 hypothetical protein H310_12993 [Aphanomyces invadans]